MKKEFNDDVLKGEIIIDRPLTVFTGRDGTGKSYAAHKIKETANKVLNGMLSPQEFKKLNIDKDTFSRLRIGNLVQKIEKDVFGFEIKEQGGVEIIIFDDGSIKYIEFTPTSIYAFAQTILALKYRALNGGIVVFDTPEAYQDPHNQILIARFITRLANAGFKIVLVTHSDYILRELNNMIILGAFEGAERGGQRQALMDKWGITADMCINASQVRAYKFSGGRVSETEVTNEGVSAEWLDEIIQTAQERTDNVYQLLSNKFEC